MGGNNGNRSSNGNCVYLARRLQPCVCELLVFICRPFQSSSSVSMHGRHGRIKAEKDTTTEGVCGMGQGAQGCQPWHLFG